MIALYFAGGHTFSIPALMGQAYSPQFQFWAFLAFFFAFAVKVPMFPFHTWLPDAHVEAPTAGSVILASVLLKMGGYGFIRFCLPMLPQASASFTPLILVLSVVAIIYGAYMALAQVDLKKLIAYSSVSHMGFVMLGLFVFTVQGIEGAMLQMINHGITTGALFLCVGMVYDRTHSRLISDYGGLAKTMPIYATMLVIFSLSSLGLPGTNSFVGEFLVLLGAFITYPVFAVVASVGIILAAVYMLWMVQRVVFGEPNPKNARHPDLNLRELATVVPLVVAVFWIGVYPTPLLDVLHVSVDHLLEQTKLTDSAVASLGWSDLWGMVRAAFAS
jgi:NADH-quinone oxidoreductase subunit M